MKLNHETYRLYAAKHYTNTNCEDIKEFSEDLARAQLAKKLLKRWKDGHNINVRLLLNHIIMFTNVFEITAAKDMLMFVAAEHASAMKTLLLYLNFLADGEYKKVKYDLTMVKELKNLK